MSIHTRMESRSEREKDLLKYGRRMGREQVIEVAKKWLEVDGDPESLIEFLSDKCWYVEGLVTPLSKYASSCNCGGLEPVCPAHSGVGAE